MTNRLIFATASPRRHALAQKIKFVNPDAETRERLFERVGFSCFDAVFAPQNVDECAAGTAEETAALNARKKGEAAVEKFDDIIIAFDTVVSLNGAVFGKPKDRKAAIGMFETLCGNTHEVVTAVYMRYMSKIFEKSEKTLVTFGAFDKELVYNYVESGAPFDKAGGYNIDDAEIKPLIKGIEGDYDNIVGLPVKLIEKLLEEIVYGKAGYSS